jgi:hypothetical protein
MNEPLQFTATIIFCAFGGGGTYCINVPDDGSKTIAHKLSIAWRQTNHVDETEVIKNLPVRSSSVGDIIGIDGRHFIINNTGFIEVSIEVALAWQSLPSRDVSMGWDWVLKHAPQVNVNGRIVKIEGKFVAA